MNWTMAYTDEGEFIAWFGEIDSNPTIRYNIFEHGKDGNPKYGGVATAGGMNPFIIGTLPAFFDTPEEAARAMKGKIAAWLLDFHRDVKEEITSDDTFEKLEAQGEEIDAT